MTLKEIAQEYRNDDAVIQATIKKLRERLKTESGEQKLITRRHLLTFYEMSRDLRETAFLLEHYYGKDDKNGI